MFLRPTPTHTLDTIDELLPGPSREQIVTLSNGRVRLTGDEPVLSFRNEIGEASGFEVPMSTEGIEHLAKRLGAPPKLLLSHDDDFRELILNALLERDNKAEEVLRWSDDGIRGFFTTAQATVPFERLVDTIRRVMPGGSTINDFTFDSNIFSFDAIVPEDFDGGWGGDREITILAHNGRPQVGDLSAGGLRLLYPYARNLRPQTSALLYRLICTNGMVREAESDVFDGRGLGVDEVLDNLEAAARLAFNRVESEIMSFYALREERIENPERTMLRIAHEQGLSDLVARELAESFAPQTESTMFDLVNAITNYANDPRHRPNKRRSLQAIGGRIVGEHVERCGTCQSRIS